jgi:hypothetical protein
VDLNVGGSSPLTHPWPRKCLPVGIVVTTLRWPFSPSRTPDNAHLAGTDRLAGRAAPERRRDSRFPGRPARDPNRGTLSRSQTPPQALKRSMDCLLNRKRSRCRAPVRSGHDSIGIYEPAAAIFSLSSSYVALTLVPKAEMVIRQATMIKASITAYSTAVGPSSSLRKTTSPFPVFRAISPER